MIVNAYIKESSMIVELGIFAAAFIVMMIIPGHFLNFKAKKMNNGGRDCQFAVAINEEASHV